jgi:hypothetical protein
VQLEQHARLPSVEWSSTKMISALRPSAPISPSAWLISS